MAKVNTFKLTTLIFTLSLVALLIPVDDSFANCLGDKYAAEYNNCINQPTVGSTTVTVAKEANCREKAKNAACSVTPYQPSRATPSYNDLCAPNKCDDKDPCTQDFCNPSSYGQCFYSKIPGCGVAPPPMAPPVPAPAAPQPQTPAQPAQPPAGPQPAQPPPAQPAQPAKPAEAPEPPRVVAPAEGAKPAEQVQPVPPAQPEQEPVVTPVAPEPAPPPAPQPSYSCNDVNSCTEDSLSSSGECVYTLLPNGTICKYDRNTGNPSVACLNGSCQSELTQPPASLPVVVTNPQPTTPYRAPAQVPVRPRVTCSYQGLNYSVSDKIYECLEPRKQGSCEEGAGLGIPYICDKNGGWGISNDGLAECSESCPVNYSPLIVDINQPEVPVNDYCFGEMYYKCGEDNQNLLLPNWFITEKFGQGSCNVFIRDEFGDHTISNECNATWSGLEVPGGAQVKNGGTYVLYISNGSETCYNQLAAQTQLNCEAPSGEVPTEEPTEEEKPFFPIRNWLEDWM